MSEHTVDAKKKPVRCTKLPYKLLAYDHTDTQTSKAYTTYHKRNSEYIDDLGRFRWVKPTSILGWTPHQNHNRKKNTFNVPASKNQNIAYTQKTGTFVHISIFRKCINKLYTMIVRLAKPRPMPIKFRKHRHTPKNKKQNVHCVPTHTESKQ